MKVVFEELPWDKDPLKGRYGMHWYERRPKHLGKDEWVELATAVLRRDISHSHYMEWLRLNGVKAE
jgi:hypothetical protein